MSISSRKLIGNCRKNSHSATRIFAETQYKLFSFVRSSQRPVGTKSCFSRSLILLAVLRSAIPRDLNLATQLHLTVVRQVARSCKFTAIQVLSETKNSHVLAADTSETPGFLDPMTP